MGISGLHTEHYVWRHIPKDQSCGAQIDLLIDRADQCINICEIKFSKTKFDISTKYALELQHKLDIFQSRTKTRKTLFLTMVTTHGIQNPMSHAGLIQSEVNMDALFQQIK